MNQVNVNIYRSSGDQATVQRFEFQDGGPCNLPDGSFILHSQSFEDSSGDYIEIWASVPKKSVALKKNLNVLGAEVGASGLPAIIGKDYDDYDDTEEDD